MTASFPTTADAPSPMRLSSLERMYRQSVLFGWQLRGRDRSRLRAGLQDPWRGDPVRGADLIAYRLDIKTISDVHASFQWLRDLRAEGGAAARSRARDLIKEWIDANQRWQLAHWRPDLTGERLAILALNYGWYGDSADEAFQEKLTKSVEMQLRSLAIDWRRMKSVDAQVTALAGIALAESALTESGRAESGRAESGRGGASRLEALLQLLQPKLDGLVLADGGHVSRMPDRHVALMRKLVEIRMATSQTGADATALSDLITRMGAVTRMWRHGDGRLVHFNGGGSVSAEMVEETLLRSGVRGKPLQQAPYSGFLRLGSGRTVVIMDAGDPAYSPTDADRIVSLGTLGFEMSIGSTQLIVNPGQTVEDPNLLRIMCSTAAHTALGLDNQNSSNPREGRIASISGVEVGEAPGGILAVASHDGFDASHGILHHRKLYLKTGGANLRGADTLEYTGAPGEIPNLAIIRFHLHPRVTAAMLANGSVLMKIRGSRTGWTMKADGAVAEIDNSVYFEDGVRHASQQIVLKTVIDDIRTTGSCEIRWAFTRSTQ